MKVQIHQIPAPGIEVSFGAKSDWAFQSARGSVEGEPANLRGVIEVKRGKGAQVWANIQASCTTERICERCGEAFVLPVTVDEKLVYLPIGHDFDHEVELDAGELDVGWYENDELDLADVLSETLALALPPRIVCVDQVACDDRTRTLLDARGQSGSAAHPAFAALKEKLSS